ncbi:MAG: M20/M25/M40 family metallo-hydrolase [Solirubrobacteraceae bacterium]
MSDLQAETTALLQELIRFDTVNPPGNERAAQERLAAYLGDAGLETTLVGAEPGRPNLVARLRGDEPGPALCLLSHVDTVLAEPGEWSHDPWSGDLADGFLWGRGALDMKSQTAAEAVAAATLAREGWRPARGDLLVVSVVDEETGGGLGARWLCAEHPELVRCDWLLNEGGGEVIPYDGRRLYGICCGEKGVYRFRLSTTGVAGHASIPAMGDNALLKMAPILERLGAAQPSWEPTEIARGFLRGLGEDPDDPAAAVASVAARDPLLAVLVAPVLGVTLTPTRISASEKINVIPSRATLGVDCRVPPGLGEEAARRGIEEVLGPDGYELEFSETVRGNGSLPEGPLHDALAEWVAAQDPGAETIPVILPGYTDSVAFRDAFPDMVAYGFFPQRHMTIYDTAPLIHSADERIDVRDLGFAAACYRDVARRLLG